MSCSLFVCYFLKIFKAAPPETAVTIMPHHDNRGTVPKLSKKNLLGRGARIEAFHSSLEMLIRSQP